MRFIDMGERKTISKLYIEFEKLFSFIRVDVKGCIHVTAIQRCVNSIPNEINIVSIFQPHWLISLSKQQNTEINITEFKNIYSEIDCDDSSIVSIQRIDVDFEWYLNMS